MGEQNLLPGQNHRLKSRHLHLHRDSRAPTRLLALRPIRLQRGIRGSRLRQRQQPVRDAGAHGMYLAPARRLPTVPELRA